MASQTQGPRAAQKTIANAAYQKVMCARRKLKDPMYAADDDRLLEQFFSSEAAKLFVSSGTYMHGRDAATETSKGNATANPAR